MKARIEEQNVQNLEYELEEGAGSYALGWSDASTQVEWTRHMRTDDDVEARCHVRVGRGDLCVVEPGESMSTPSFLSELLIVMIDRRRDRMVAAMVDAPDTRVDPGRARWMPHAFVDRALPELLRAIDAPREAISVVLIGGGHKVWEDELFHPGRRTMQVALRRLEHLGLEIIAHDLGGVQPRFVGGSLGEGSFVVTHADGKLVELSNLGK